MGKRWWLVSSIAVAAMSIVCCASNGRPWYQTGPGWEYYYDHFKPVLTHIGAGNSPASGDAYDADPEFFFWNHVKTDKLAVGMRDEDVLTEAALRPDKTYRTRDKRNRPVELWVYRKDCSQFLRTDEDIPKENILIILQFVNGRLVDWEPKGLPVVSPDNLQPGSGRPLSPAVVGG